MLGKTSRFGRVVFIILLGYWTLAFVSTHLPGDTVQAAKRAWMLSWPHMDKVAHAILYAGLSFLVLGYLRWSWRLSQALANGIAVSVAAVYGALDEYLQSFIPKRSMDMADWLADLFGAGLGVLGFMVILQASPLRPSFPVWKTGRQSLSQ